MKKVQHAEAKHTFTPMIHKTIKFVFNKHPREHHESFELQFVLLFLIHVRGLLASDLYKVRWNTKRNVSRLQPYSSTVQYSSLNSL